MTQPDPGQHPAPGPAIQHYSGQPAYGQPPGIGAYPPHPQGTFQPVQQLPQTYHKLRTVALVSVALIGITCLAALIETVLLWLAYDDVKRFAYGLISERELERAMDRWVDTSPLIDVASYLMMGTAISFLIWLWQARENSLFLRARRQQPYQHRQSQGWVVGSWFCPVVQFWYPLQIVADVSAASEPADRPGVTRTGQFRGLLYGWWATWTAFWVLLVGGALTAVSGLTIWLVRLVEQVESADATGSDLDIYDLQDFLVRAALVVNISLTVATVLLIVAGVAISLLLLRVSAWQDAQGLAPAQPVAPTEPPRYTPRPSDVPQYAPRSFPPR